MPSTTTFTTTLLAFGNNTGIEVPPDHVEALGAGKRPPVKVDVDGYTYDSTVAVMGGKYLLPLNKAHRTASGLGPGDRVTVVLELVEGERVVDVPGLLAAALEDAGLRDAFDQLSYSRRKEHARSVADATKADTAERRVAKVLEQLA
ncbi:hypothetical protein DVS28_a4740 [Euzebya pacifica]|uniref:DUF1905 domain-containing protein n=1 Tax=Euzebya pacifica TaxID=1608957 RepID=A0A346Y4K4_9ACTN|nr:YdeI/OmpD-associated family protein [Euzebya pacifica]AXV09401.1 hypothetical protein DVS28_a4740 [Euzebya pacifica]